MAPYIFDDRFIDVMPPKRHVLHEVLSDMASGMREEYRKRNATPMVRMVGALADLCIWPLKVKI